GLELADVAGGLGVLVDLGFVVAGAEVAEAGGGVGEQVPDDDQDGPGDRNLGFGAAAAAGDPPVAFPQEGRGFGGSGGGLAELAAQVAAALVFGLAAARPGLEGPGTEPGPGHQVPWGGEAGHVQAGLGDDGGGHLQADAGDLIQPGGGRQRRGAWAGAGIGAGGAVGADAPGLTDLRELGADAGGQLADPFIDEGDLVQQQLGE